MAIFRQGKRVGIFDIRGGISRGDYKSSAYHKTDRDPRFKMQANTDTTIGRFRAAMNASEGYARPARFAVRIFPPSNLQKMVEQQNNVINREQQVLLSSDSTSGTSGVMNDDPFAGRSSKYMNDLVLTYGRQVNIHCENVSMPGVTLDSQSIQRGSEPARDQVVGHNYEGEIQATFYADKYLRERHFFEAWQKLAVEPIGHKANYYDNYVGKMHIYQLGDDNDINEIRDMPSYGIEAIEVYPKTIAAVEYGYGKSNEIVRVQVGFAYKQWYNMGTNPESGRLSDDTLPFGTLRQRAAQVKARNPGLLGMLPPSIGRAARGAISQGRTVLNPVGRIFKGKVFPPFT
jgi:hypothetical protein